MILVSQTLTSSPRYSMIDVLTTSTHIVCLMPTHTALPPHTHTDRLGICANHAFSPHERPNPWPEGTHPSRLTALPGNGAVQPECLPRYLFLTSTVKVQPKGLYPADQLRKTVPVGYVVSNKLPAVATNLLTITAVAKGRRQLFVDRFRPIRCWYVSYFILDHHRRGSSFHTGLPCGRPELRHHQGDGVSAVTTGSPSVW